MIHFGVMHLPRPDRVELLGRTVLSLVSAGASHINIYRDNHKTGPTATLIRSLRALALEQKDPNELVCMVDDDLVFAPDAVMAAWTHLRSVPPSSALAMWTIEQNIPHEERHKRGLVRVEASRNIWGGCVVMPSIMAQWVANEMEQQWKADPYLDRSPDGCLFAAIGWLGHALYHPIPSLVDHVGMERSTIGNDHSNGATRGYRFNEWFT